MKARPLGRRRLGEAGLAYALLLPSALILGTFGFVPLVNAVLLSMRQWKREPGAFVGLGNYSQALHSPDFWQSLTVTLYYVLGTVPATLVLSYLLAELLHRKLKGEGFYRTLFFVPYVVSPVAAAAVWMLLFDPSVGPLSAMAERFGWHPRWLGEGTGVVQLAAQGLGASVPAWAGGPSLALACIIVVSVWHGVGFAVVVLLAALSALPEEVIEAARIDGARAWSLFRHVRLPLLSPALFFLVVVLTIRAFQTFTQIYVLSVDGRGGPQGTTRNITMYIFQSFYQSRDALGPGYGAAVAMILFVIILALTLFQFRVLGRRVHYG